MKKITFASILALLISFGINAQADLLDYGSVPNYSPEITQADCEFGWANQNAYGGAVNVARYASRFIINEAETFQANKVTILMGVVNEPSYVIDETTEFKFTVYTDTGIGPDEEVTSVINTPTSSLFVETITLVSGAVWDLYEVEVDLSDFDLISASPTFDTPFFFGIEMTEDDGVQVGLNFDVAAPDTMTYFDSGEGWTIFNAPDTTFTYSLEGDCSALSVNDNLLSQVSVYPNPATDFLNIKTNTSLEISEVIVYDLLGRNTGAVFTNGTVNVSGLSRGVYMLTVNTSEGTLTQKVVKK